MTNCCLLLTVQCVGSKLFKWLNIPSIGTGSFPFSPYPIPQSAVHRPHRLEHSLSNFRKFLTYRIIFLYLGLILPSVLYLSPLGSTCDVRHKEGSLASARNCTPICVTCTVCPRINIPNRRSNNVTGNCAEHRR